MISVSTVGPRSHREEDREAATEAGDWHREHTFLSLDVKTEVWRHSGRACAPYFVIVVTDTCVICMS